MGPPHEDILDRLRHLPPNRVYDLGLDRRVRRDQPPEQPPFPDTQVVDARGLGAVVPEKVLHAFGGNAELEAALAELAEIGGLAARERLLVGPRTLRPR